MRSKDTSHLKGVGASQLAYHLFLLDDCPQVGWKALKLLDTKLFNEKRAFSYKKAFHQKHGYLWDSISKDLPNIVVDDSFYIGLRKCIEQNSDLPYYRKFYEDYFAKFNVDSIIDFFYTLREEEKDMSKRLLVAAVQYYRDEVYEKGLRWKKDNKKQLKRDAKKNKKLDKKQDWSAMTENEKLLFAKLHDKRKAQDEAFSDFTARNLRKNQTDKYSEEAHFIYELLQNADDALATYAKFELLEDKLLFRHNGKPFSISEDVEDAKPYGDINSITAPAYSAKQFDKQKIGKFGVGFKSVYIYTDEPEIYSGHFSFKIIHQIVPEVIEECAYERKENETLFVMRYKDVANDRAVIEKKLRELESPLLFLNHLKDIEWKENDEIHKYTKQERITNTLGNISISQVIETNDESKIEYCMFSKPVDLGEHGKHYIYVGYPLDKYGLLDTSKFRKVFCFFPTKTCYGMVTIMQAPFLLTESREQVLPYEQVNKTLRKELATLMGETLPLLVKMSDRDKHLINVNLRDIIPYDYHPTTYWGSKYSSRGVTDGDDIKEFYNCFKQHLLNDNLFLTVNGEYLTRDKVMFTSLKMKGLINREQMNMLMGKSNNELDFLSYEVSSDFQKFLVNEIDLKEFNSDTLVNKIDSSFMKKQSSEWIESLYKYLRWSRTSKYCSFVKTNQGEYASLYFRNDEQRLFAPISSSINTTSISKVEFIDAETYAKHKDFFDWQDIKEPDKIDYLKVLLQKYAEDEAEKLSDKEILSDIHIVEELVSQYKNAEKEDELYDVLQNRLKFKAQYQGNSVIDLASKLFLPNKELKDYAYLTESHIKFLDIEFYVNGDIPQNDLLSLAKKLGIKTHAEIDHISYFSFDYSSEQGDNVEQVYMDKNSLSQYLQEQVSKPNDLYELQGLEDYDIVNFEKIDFSSDLSKFIWRSLLQYHVDKVSVSKLYYRVWHGSKWYDYTFESSLLKKLKETKWIVKADGIKVCPTDILKEEFHKLGYKESEEWEEVLEVGIKAQERNESDREKANQEISDMWGNDPIVAGLWAKLKTLCEDNGISIYKLLSNVQKNEGTNPEKTNKIDIADSSVGSSYEDLLDDIEALKTPSLVRKTEHYIGVKLYEGLLNKENLSFEEPDKEKNQKFGYDLKVLPNKLVKISVVKDKEIDKEKHAPIGITKDQHAYMNSSNTNRYTIIRIALKDLEIDFDRGIRDIYGAEADIDEDSHLKAKCDKLVKDYWSSKTSEDFKKMTSEYSIQIFREL